MKKSNASKAPKKYWSHKRTPRCTTYQQRHRKLQLIHPQSPLGTARQTEVLHPCKTRLQVLLTELTLTTSHKTRTLCQCKSRANVNSAHSFSNHCTCGIMVRSGAVLFTDSRGLKCGSHWPVFSWHFGSNFPAKDSFVSSDNQAIGFLAVDYFICTGTIHLEPA